MWYVCLQRDKDNYNKFCLIEQCLIADEFSPSAIRARCENAMDKVEEVCTAVFNAYKNTNCITAKIGNEPESEPQVLGTLFPEIEAMGYFNI